MYYYKELMNQEAANRLLKTLEDLLMIIVYLCCLQRISAVLPTVASRCLLTAELKI